MSAAAIRGVVRRLGPPADPPPDADLVAAFAARRDSDAFAAIVSRHGPTVFGVCRRVLGDTHDAEDAFQAVFLVLALKASTIRPHGAVGGWLYGVAVRTANKAKVAAARRRRREMIAAKAQSNSGREVGGEVENTELQSALDDEVAKLPDALRAVLVLCDLHGKTRAEAAAELGCPEGTVAARLHRARKKLADALSRRGLALPTAGLATVLTPITVSAAVNRSAIATALGSAPPVVLALAREVTRNMASAKIVLAFSVLTLVAGGLFAAGSMWPSDSPDPPAPQSPVEVKMARPADAKPASPWREVKVLEQVGWLGGSVAYSPDGKALFIGGTGGLVRAYETATWKTLWDYDGGGRFAAIAIAHDGKQLAVTVKDGVQFLDAATGKAGDAVEEKGSEPITVGWFPDSPVFDDQGALIATSRKLIFGNARGYFVKSWLKWPQVSTITTTTVAAEKEPADVHAVPIAVDPDGKRVAVKGPIDPATGKNVLWAWAAGSGAGNKLLEGHKATVVAAAWSKDGKSIVTGDSAGVVIAWDAVTFKEKSRVSLEGRVAAVAISPDGKHTAAAVVQPRGLDGRLGAIEEVFVWPATVPQAEPARIFGDRTVGMFQRGASLAFAPDGKSLAAAFANDVPPIRGGGLLAGKVRIFSIEADQPVKPDLEAAQKWNDTAVVTDHGTLVDSVAFAPDGKTFAIGGPGGEAANTVTVWDTATRKSVWKGGVFPAGRTAVAYSPDGKFLAATRDKVTGFFNPENGQPVLMNPPIPGGHALAFGPNSDRIAVSNGKNTIVRFFPPDGEASMAGPPEAEKNPNRLSAGVAWSKDGKRLALIRHGKYEGKWPVVLWGAGSGEPMTVLAGHSEPVTAVAWSNDGKVIASGSEDGHVVLWDAETGKELWRKEFKGRTTTGRVNALAISPADNTIAAAVSLGSGKGPERVVLLEPKDGKDIDHLMRVWSIPVTSVAWSHDGKLLLTGCGSAGTPIEEKEPKVGEVVIWERKP